MRTVCDDELFESVDALLEATRDFFNRMNHAPQRTFIGAHPA